MAEYVESLEYKLYYSSIPFFVIGFIGNVLLIRIVHKTREMHTPTNFLLASMAASDIITILLWSFYFFEFAKFVCKFVVLIEISIKVSSITLTVLAIERYNAILTPFRAGLWLTQDKIKYTICFIWFASLVICFPEFFLKEWSETEERCIGPWTFHMNQASKIYMVINITIVFLEMVTICYCYGCLMKGLYFSNRVYSQTERDASSEKKKLVITLMISTTLFSIAFAPVVVFYAIVTTRNNEQLDQDYELYAILVGVFDFTFVFAVSFNPIIYGFRATKFREEFKNIILCRRMISPLDVNHSRDRVVRSNPLNVFKHEQFLTKTFGGNTSLTNTV